MERQLEGMRQRLTERRRSEMNDPNELADRHVALWNEPDPRPALESATKS
jgi:hypothetical protein